LRCIRTFGLKELIITDNILETSGASDLAVEIDQDSGGNKVQRLIYQNNLLRRGTKYINYSAVVRCDQEVRVIATDATVGANVGAAETDLASVTIPANTLRETGDCLEFEGAGILVGSANSKRIRVYLGATEIYDSFGVPVPTTSDFRIRGAITHSAVAGIANGHVELLTELAIGATVMDYTSPAEDMTTDLVLRVTGAGGVDNEVLLGYFKVKFVGLP
jgi:hypothetical protein